MGYDLTFALDGLFEGEEDAPATREALASMLRALLEIDEAWLRRNPLAPRLYASGVRYLAEPRGEEKWQNVPRVLRLGHGDCEDLAVWRAGELRVRDGVPARPAIRWRRLPDGRYLYHIVVELPGGRIEDPSAILGMPTSNVSPPATLVSRVVAGLVGHGSWQIAAAPPELFPLFWGQAA